MYRVADITTNSFSLRTGKFSTTSLDYLKVYNSDSSGTGDYILKLQDVNNEEIIDISGSWNIYKFVRKESNNIIGCIPICFLNNDNLVCYQLNKWTDLDTKLYKLLTLSNILDKNETILKHTVYTYNIHNFCFENFGSISKYILSAFSDQSLSDFDLYIPEATSIYAQLGIKDNFIYFLVSDDLVYEYEFKDKKRFLGLLSKQLILKRRENDENLLFSRSEWYRKRYNTNKSAKPRGRLT